MLLNLIIEKRAESPLCPESRPFFQSFLLCGRKCPVFFFNGALMAMLCFPLLFKRTRRVFCVGPHTRGKVSSGPDVRRERRAPPRERICFFVPIFGRLPA